jgi:protein gp37
MGQVKYQNDGDPRTSGPGFDLTLHPEALDIPRAWRSPQRVFVNSMSDLFHPRVPLDYVRRVFTVMAETPQHQYQVLTKRPLRVARWADKLQWPANVWLGTSVENDDHTNRIDHLRAVPATIRFLSLEPLIGPIPGIDLAHIDWVIVGGESGARARRVDPAWVRQLRDAALAQHVPFFFKQWGGRTPKAGGRELDGRTWDEYPAATPAPGYMSNRRRSIAS